MQTSLSRGPERHPSVDGRVLVTGGAGFIGSHLVDALRESGTDVRVLDNLDPQAHGDEAALPEHFQDVEFIRGDVTDKESWDRALDGVTHVVHFAAVVGLAQSMYEIEHYTHANVMGTARLLQRVAENKGGLRKLIVASSMSLYGEGLYRCSNCSFEGSNTRTKQDLEARRWEVKCPRCGHELQPIPTPEDKRLEPSFVYSINKRDQEEMCLAVGRAYDVSTIALRFFSAYGPRQALSNPYTGVAAIFASRLLGGKPPLIFEDGRQTRDFVHVSDVVDSVVKALWRDDVGDVALNIGTGNPVTITDVASTIQEAMGGPEAEVLNTYRHGDIRHCFPDVSLARKVLDWEAKVSLTEGVRDLVPWVVSQSGHAERVDDAFEELRRRGLLEDR